MKQQNRTYSAWEIDERAKCRRDPIYFIENYVMISHQTRGDMLFKLYDYQKELIYKFFLPEYRLHLIVKSRQLGVSTVYSALCLWLILFFPSKTVAIVAPDKDKATEFHEKVIFAYDNLPDFLRDPYKKKNTTLLHLKNNARVKAYAYSPTKGIRSIAASVVIMDEAHYIPKAEKIWSAIQPALSTGGQFIGLSSPAEPTGWFYASYKAIIEGTDSEKKMTKLPWWVHPERQNADKTPNWDWRRKQDIEIGDPREASQEYDAEFGISKDIYFSKKVIDRIGTMVEEPIKKINNFWIWKLPEPNKEYLASIDCAEGGGDNNCIQILEMPSLEQVAEYVNNEHYEIFPFKIAEYCQMYNDALAIVEHNSIGAAVIVKLKDIYHNVFMTGQGKEKKILGITKSYFGWKTTPKTRPIMISSLDNNFESDDHFTIIRSERTYNEIKTFIVVNGKPQAKQGAKDDTVVALSIGYTVFQLRGTSLMSEANDNQEEQDNTLNGMLGFYALAKENALERLEDYKKQQEDESYLSMEEKEELLSFYLPKSIQNIHKKHKIPDFSRLVNS